MTSHGADKLVIRAISDRVAYLVIFKRAEKYEAITLRQRKMF